MHAHAKVTLAVYIVIDAITGIGDSWLGHRRIAGGPGEDRTPDPMVANPA
jgi:hypothetical protein